MPCRVYKYPKKAKRKKKGRKKRKPYRYIKGRKYKYQVKNMSKNTNKLKEVRVYIICNNRQIKQFDVNASRKFNIKDETYVIKESRCYLKKFENEYKEVSFYIEGNPNPLKLEPNYVNEGLTQTELDGFIGADLFNILVECQEADRSRYIFQMVILTFGFGFLTFLVNVVFGG